jgi:mxaJ protein
MCSSSRNRTVRRQPGAAKQNPEPTAKCDRRYPAGASGFFAFRIPGLTALVLALALFAAPVHARELRVCADPNNLPFSNERGEGFENKIVALVAEELGATVEYTWWAQRRGYVRNTLKAGLCDLVPGVASGFEMLRTTIPYYRSAYVFVTRPDGPAVQSLDDPVLREARVGVQLVGDDGVNTPPAHALARRGIVDNVRGYSLYGDYREPNPPARIVEAVRAGEIDVALAWGPMAGYFAVQEPAVLRVTPVVPLADGPRLPMVFDIGMGVRRGEDAFRAEIEGALRRRQADIDAILSEYRVPRLDLRVTEARGP